MASAKFVLAAQPGGKSAENTQQRAAIQAASPAPDWVQIGNGGTPPKTTTPAAFQAALPTPRMGASQPKAKPSKGNIGPAVPLT